MSSRRLWPLLGTYAVAFVSAYVLWVFFSYLFVPVEASIEIAVPQWPRDGYYTFRPGQYENRRYGVTYTINSRGFRGPEFQVEKSRYRIICVGESSTAGMESSDSDTWPARLQHYLGDGVEVINAGISGSTSRDHRAMLRDLLTYRPDLILYYAGRNDHAITSVERYPGPQAWQAGRLNFLRHWFLYKRVQLRMLLLPATDIERWVTWSSGWAWTYRENLAAIYRDTSEAGVRFVAVSQVLDRMEAPLSMGTGGWHERLLQRDVLMVQQDVLPVDQFVDVRTAFAAAGETLFYDPVHLTPRGNDVLAQAVVGALRERAIVPKRPAARR